MYTIFLYFFGDSVKQGEQATQIIIGPMYCTSNLLGCIFRLTVRKTDQTYFIFAKMGF